MAWPIQFHPTYELANEVQNYLIAQEIDAEVEYVPRNYASVLVESSSNYAVIIHPEDFYRAYEILYPDTPVVPNDAELCPFCGAEYKQRTDSLLGLLSSIIPAPNVEDNFTKAISCDRCGQKFPDPETLV